MRALICSLDRPLQLDGCLRSLRLHAAEPVEVCVLWRGSTARMRNAYDQLRAEYGDVAWIEESDFEAEFRGLLASAGEHVMFVVDDTIFTGDFSPARCARLLDNRPDAIGFSLRLGRNTTYCYPTDRAQTAPFLSGIDVLCFDWIGADGDFGYPLEVSSSIYRTCDIQLILESGTFRNPNELETLLASQLNAAAGRPNLFCFSQSVAFSLPCNRVQQQFANRVSGDVTATPEMLLYAWQRGERMAIAAYSGMVTKGCHQEATLWLTPGASRSAIAQQANEATHAAVLGGMGYGIGGADFDASGERWLLGEVARMTAGRTAVVFDVGANRGDWSALALRVMPAAVMHCVEPSRMWATLAARQARVHQIHECALSDHEGTATLHADAPGSGDASLHKRDLTHIGRSFEHEERVALRTLDSVCRENDINQIDLLKIDVEGSELAVLRGASEMIARGAIGVIQFEGGGTWIDSRIFFRDFWRLLSPKYRIGRLMRDGIAWIDTYEERLEVFVGPTNYLAVLK